MEQKTGALPARDADSTRRSASSNNLEILASALHLKGEGK